MRAVSILAGLAVAASLATGAQAAIVDLKFESASYATPGYQFSGPNVYLTEQIAFFENADNKDYAFHFTYDTDAAGPNYGLTLVSGRLGAVTDFSAFASAMTFGPSSHMFVRLTRTQFAGSSTYTTGAYFILQDNDGDIGATLPTDLDFADLDMATASFETRRSGGVGMGHRNVQYGGMLGGARVPTGDGDPPGGGTGDPTGAIPEPSTWAMMILGFGAAGVAIRRRYAASNCRAASRA